MREVSCRALELIEHSATKNGLRYGDLIDGLPITLDQLRNPAERIDWDVLAELLERLERATSPEASLRMGREAIKLEVVGPLQRIARVAVNLRLLYRAGLQWQLPLLYRHILVRTEAMGSRQLRVDVTIPERFRGSRPWLRLLQGGLEALPSMCGLPWATVDAEISDHRAIYQITLPKQSWHLLPLLRTLFADTALTELERQIEELRAIEYERARVDDALRERERMLSTLIANLSGMVYRCRSDDWSFEFAGGQCFEFTGYQPEELVTQRISSLALMHPDDAERLREKRQASLDAHESCSNEYRVRTRSGEQCWVLDVARGLYDAQGRATGMEGFITDVTARKRIEEELSHALREESIGRLAGGIAHDFNNLLSVILGCTELARLKLPDDSGAVEYTDQIVDAAQRAAGLTRQLLAFARRQMIEPTVVDLNQLVRDMDALLRRTLIEAVTLSCVFSDDVWCVEVDPGQFEQVLLNLALNARDAMPHGGVLMIETANIVLEEASPVLPGLTPGLYVMLAVRDTGTGMDDETQRRAFEPFFTTKGIGKGTGLGLASSHGIVRQAGGHIFLSSEPGHGTSFCIYLPRAIGDRQSAKPESMRPEPLPPTQPKALTVLVVEDHDLLRGIVVRTLEAQGYGVITAASGLEALTLIAARPELRFDLLLSDVVMPDLGGPDLAATLSERRPGLPVLYMSGYSEQSVLRELRANSAASFLAKPFTPAALAKKVREILDYNALKSRRRSARVAHPA
jgi:PAS domain S-box-containing protein